MAGEFVSLGMEAAAGDYNDIGAFGNKEIVVNEVVYVALRDACRDEDLFAFSL